MIAAHSFLWIGLFAADDVAIDAIQIQMFTVYFVPGMDIVVEVAGVTPVRFVVAGETSVEVAK